MPTQILGKTVAEWIFRSSAYNPTGNNALSTGGPTVVDLTLSSVAAAAAVNSDQVDLGATRPEVIEVNAAIEWHAAITAGGTVDFYWAPSSHSSDGVGNPGRVAGTDGAYAGDGGGTVAESVLQLQFIGSLVTTDLLGVQIGYVGRFSPIQRYGQLVVVNNSSTTLCGTDDIESAVLFSGWSAEAQ